MTRVTFTDIAPDGVRMVVDWEKFVPGSSVFIPCINTGEAMSSLNRLSLTLWLHPFHGFLLLCVLRLSYL